MSFGLSMETTEGNQMRKTRIEQLALDATFKIHSELLRANDAFDNYDGTKEQFDRLYREVFIIARDEVALEVEPIEGITETFYQYQLEIAQGYRDCCWFL